jgi:hypothetical protein
MQMGIAMAYKNCKPNVCVTQRALAKQADEWLV